MLLARLSRPFSLLLAAALLWSASAVAQSPVDPGKLPGRTLFYLFWHGAPSGEIRKNNALYALWDDPQFAPVRASFADSFFNEAKNQKNQERTDHFEG